MCSTSEKGCFILIPLGGCSSGQRRGAPRSPRRPRGAPGAIFGPKNACRASARARERAERSSHWDKSILLKILQRSVLGAAPPAAPPVVGGRGRADGGNERKREMRVKPTLGSPQVHGCRGKSSRLYHSQALQILHRLAMAAAPCRGRGAERPGRARREPNV